MSHMRELLIALGGDPDASFKVGDMVRLKDSDEPFRPIVSIQGSALRLGLTSGELHISAAFAEKRDS